MVKYHSTAVVFQEVPGEISLAINITNCQGRCPGCHSPHLREDIGQELLPDLPQLIYENDGITCILFMGEGNDPIGLQDCIDYVKLRGFKTCIYSGQELQVPPYRNLDYIKYGPYVEELGGLNKPGTNQCLLKHTDDTRCDLCAWEDITHLLQR